MTGNTRTKLVYTVVISTADPAYEDEETLMADARDIASVLLETIGKDSGLAQYGFIVESVMYAAHD